MNVATLSAWLRAFGHLGMSIDLDTRLLDRCDALVQSGRRDLRNDLASAYNNRGIAYEQQGDLSAAVADYGKAVEIRETLVAAVG